MGIIEELFYQFCESKSSEEATEEYKRLEKMQAEVKLDLDDDDTFTSFLSYLSEVEERYFTDGFKCAMSLMKECKI